MEPRFPEFTPRQREFAQAVSRHRYTLFGGAAGAGKSFTLRWLVVLGLIHLYKTRGLKNVEAGLFCEDYPALEGRQMSKIRAEMDVPWLGTWNQSRHTLTLLDSLGGGMLRCLNLDDPGKYRSNEWAIIAIDELTMNVRQVFDDLIWRMRWPGLNSPKFMAGTNPTGKGHLWTKKLWVDRDFHDEPQALNPLDFAYVPAKATDNPHLPPTYYTETLASLPEHMRKALMEGSWDVVEGQYFTDFDRALHVVPPRKYQEGITDEWGIPLSWQRFGGIDWGRAAPWAAIECAVDEDGRVICYRHVAEAGWEHDQQAEWLLKGAPGVTWYADDACWAKGAGNSKRSRAVDMSHVELWQEAAGGRLSLMPAKKGSRVPGWLHLNGFLKRMPPTKDKDGNEVLATKAWIEFHDTPAMNSQHGILTTFPKVIKDPDKPDDVLTTCDDHAVEALRYALISRPSPALVPEKPKGRPFGDRDYKHDAYEDVFADRGGKTVIGDW